MSAGSRGSTIFGTVLRVAVACALVAIVVDAWLVAGLISPVVVVSGSMSPTLRGPHRAWTCLGCQREFVRERESLPDQGNAGVCPHCRATNDADRGIDRPGDRVYVDRSAFTWRTPRRWEMIVLARPDLPSQWCVKRVVGLPRERIEIRDGELWIDGRIATTAGANATSGPLDGRPGQFALGPDEYFLLGDNSAHSQDSRSWPQAGITSGQIVGRVLRW